ncbi:MAG: hypothetical protein ACI910_001390 [Oleispira sp.]|jgi:hypothetical protein
MAVGVTLVLLLQPSRSPLLHWHFFGGGDGRRYTVGITGAVSFIFCFFYRNVMDILKVSKYFTSKH